LDHPKDQPHAIAHVLQPTLCGENQKSRCQSLAMPNGWCRMHGDLRPALRRGIRSSARHGRRCGAACPVLALLRRADPAEWPLSATTGQSWIEHNGCLPFTQKRASPARLAISETCPRADMPSLPNVVIPTKRKTALKRLFALWVSDSFNNLEFGVRRPGGATNVVEE
jgi:hypothetical protein